jgi:6-phosphofructokinase 1
MHIGIVTSGGDSPGMNAAIRAAVRHGIALGARMTGFKYGYDGVIDGEFVDLQAQSVAGIIDRGGTLLGTGRCARMRTPEGQAAALDTLRLLKVDALLVIGGDGSLRGAHALCQNGFRAVGIPGTIDNDVWGTEATIGYDTCLNTITDAVSKIRDTASAHNRVFVVEVMGRGSGELALNAALAGGAEVVAIPEAAERPEVEACRMVEYGAKRGKLHTIVIVAEGTCTADEMAAYLTEHCSGHEVRKSVLGHMQRGGRATARDCILGTRMAARGVEALLTGESDVMVGIRGEELVFVPLEEVINGKKIPDLSLLQLIANLAS